MRELQIRIILQEIAVFILRRAQKILRILRMLTTLAQIPLQPHLGKSLLVSAKALLLQAPKAQTSSLLY